MRVDSDWPNERADGVCLKVWSSTLNVAARSSGQAERRAAVRGAAEGVCAKSVVGDFGLEMTLRVRATQVQERATKRDWALETLGSRALLDTGGRGDALPRAC